DQQDPNVTGEGVIQVADRSRNLAYNACHASNVYGGGIRRRRAAVGNDNVLRTGKGPSPRKIVNKRHRAKIIGSVLELEGGDNDAVDRPVGRERKGRGDGGTAVNQRA